LARALAAMPRILIMDESVNALDIALQEEILEMLLEYQNQYRLTILFISHQLEVIHRLCDRVFLLREGILEEKSALA
jgi:ABC-type dipeptide/oligopeptide/nickel transport system ATPase subunit